MKENSEFKPAELRLKIDLVSYPAQAEGLVNMDDHLKRKERARWDTDDLSVNTCSAIWNLSCKLLRRMTQKNINVQLFYIVLNHRIYIFFRSI